LRIVMKTNKIWMIGAALLIMLTTACREESDKLITYDHNDILAFNEASSSFAGKFKVTWNGLNQYYSLWDYEKEQGLDWDAVYDEYLPKFEEMDNRGTDDPVTDDEMEEMMRKVLSPLHDGHLAVRWKNHFTENIVTYDPSNDRIALRDDAKIAHSYTPSLMYYKDLAHDEVMTKDGQPIVMEYSTLCEDLLNDFFYTPGKGMKWITAEIERIESLTSPTDKEKSDCKHLKELANELEDVESMGDADRATQIYNNLSERYAILEVPGFDVIDPGFIDYGVKEKFALLKGNIAYFYFSDFSLTSYIDPPSKFFDLVNDVTRNHVGMIKKVWLSWFNTIQELHKKGTLGGVIIDVRGNGGGFNNDSKYVVGALLPSGGFQYGYCRFKRGTGRYDYSSLMPAISMTMDDEHEIVDDRPVVLLTNCGSVSMSEVTAQVVRLMKNGTIIGKRTHGGLCGLQSNELFSLNYSGYIGVENVTPVYGYIPQLASFTMDMEQLEGYGIEPNIEVDLNTEQFDNNGRDSQLDRALQFIRNGN